MKAHVLKHTVCAPKDITVLSPANQSTCAKDHRACQALNYIYIYIKLQMVLLAEHVFRVSIYHKTNYKRQMKATIF